MKSEEGNFDETLEKGKKSDNDGGRPIGTDCCYDDFDFSTRSKRGERDSLSSSPHFLQ